jgi:hypothetical protein
MFTAIPIGIAFVFVNLFVLLMDELAKPDSKFFQYANSIAWVLLVASVYIFAAGVFLATGWEDPFVNADKAELAVQSGQSRRGGVILLVIRFWPYVLMLMAVGGVGVSTKVIRGAKD